MPLCSRSELALALTLGLLIFAPLPAAAADGFEDGPSGPEDSGVEVSGSLGYAVLAGRLESGQRLRTRFVGGLPVRVDLGYRFESGWWAGGYVGYAVLLPTRWMDARCPSCTHSWLHMGVAGEYRWYRADEAALWVGLSAGRHTLTNGVALDEGDLRERVATGFDTTLSWGAQWKLGDGIALGPVSSLSLGTFTNLEEGCPKSDSCPKATRAAPEDPGVHFFFATALRITLLP